MSVPVSKEKPRIKGGRISHRAEKGLPLEPSVSACKNRRRLLRQSSPATNLSEAIDDLLFSVVSQDSILPSPAKADITPLVCLGSTMNLPTIVAKKLTSGQVMTDEGEFVPPRYSQITELIANITPSCVS